MYLRHVDMHICLPALKSCEKHGYCVDDDNVGWHLRTEEIVQQSLHSFLAAGREHHIGYL